MMYTFIPSILLLSLLSKISSFVPPQLTKTVGARRSRQTSFVVSPDSSTTAEHHDYGRNDDRRVVEFLNLEPLAESETRRMRLEQDHENRAKFVEFGDALWDLRSKMDKLSEKLLDAINEGEDLDEERMRRKLRAAEQRDPELVYMLELSEMEEAQKEGRTEDASIHRKRADAARAVLPQFNLDGLWVGKYGSHGYELINVTYVGDTLIAEKVTGDANVPRGEVSFQVDLNPLQHKVHGYSLPQGALQPIQLTEKAAQKWGTKQLPRYAGNGQVAEENFTNHQWMEGQLIVIGSDYFSFAWIPIEQQIFFGRPSPELALKMLREQGVQELRPPRSFEAPPTVHDNVDLQKDFARRCLDMTEEIQDDFEATADGLANCIWYGVDSDECYFE